MGDRLGPLAEDEGDLPRLPYGVFAYALEQGFLTVNPCACLEPSQSKPHRTYSCHDSCVAAPVIRGRAEPAVNLGGLTVVAHPQPTDREVVGVAVGMSHHGLVTDAQQAPIGWIREVVLNCPEPSELATFWAGLVGGEPVEWYPGWVTLEPPPRGQRLSFQASANRPDGTQVPGGPGLVHFDILVNDLDAAHERVVAAGGAFEREHFSARPSANGEPVPWRVYRDPEGHPFCLVVR